MRVFLTGGSGLIGKRIVRDLVARGDEPIVLSRRSESLRLKPAMQGVEVVQGDPTIPGPWEKAIEGVDAVINLVGHGIFLERWNDEVRKKIRDSRVNSTQNLVSAIQRAEAKPKVLVSGSAIGYYGPHGDEPLNEASPPGADFMAEVCKAWEASAAPVTAAGVRLAIVRTGVVLAREEGALKVMLPLFRLGLASPIGSKGSLLPGKGLQWFSWIHIDDIAGIFLAALDQPSASGPINGTAPNPLRNVDFSRSLTQAVKTHASILGKVKFPPFMVPFGPPDLVLGIVLGGVAEAIVKGQKVLPEAALALGYTFKFPHAAEALADLLARKTAPSAAQKPEPVAAGV